MLFVLLIHATVLLTIAAQKNLTPFGTASLSSTLDIRKTQAIKAIEPPISNTFNNENTVYCTHTTGYQATNPKPAWWMFEFSFESAYITDIQIYYKANFAVRMAGFKLYVTNTSTIPPDGYLCYEDPGPGLPEITQTIPCNQLGKYVIYYDDKNSAEFSRGIEVVYGPIVELCYVAINGCQKSYWGSGCQTDCAYNCIERNCFPVNGSCVWGCNPKNCFNDICNKDTAVCTDGCKERRTGRYCNKYSIATDASVSQSPSGSASADLANDGSISSCSNTKGNNIQFQVDLNKESIVKGMYITFGESSTREGYHTVFASNSKNLSIGKVLYNATALPTEITFTEVFRYLTYVPQAKNGISILEICEIGILGCPPSHYGSLCNTTCPENCRGPCDLDSGQCTYGCINGWSGNKCELECSAGYFGKDCNEDCSSTCLNLNCDHVTGKCIIGCRDGWQGFNCSQPCSDGQFGRNCSGFCDGCVSSICDHASGLCDNTTSCNPGYEQTEKCDFSCDDGEFGIGCANNCYCLIATCSKADGTCPPGGCEAGFHGISCNQECKSGTFGQNCKYICKGCISSMCEPIDGLCYNTSGCEPGYLYDKYCNTACDDGYFGKNCTGKCNCLTGTCDISTGICGDEFQKGSEQTSNMAAIGGSVAAFIIVVLIIVAVFKCRLIASQDTGRRTTSSDATTYETRNTTNNSQKNEQQYDDLIRMDPASLYQDLIPNSASNEYEQIDNAYVNLSVQI